MTAPLVSATDRPYQLLPPLSVEQRDLLRQSIRDNGVLEPVVFDEDGEILDGHHRVEIAEELGIDYPRRVIDDLDQPGKHMYALTVNVARRQLDQTARSGLVAQMRIRGMSIREIAKATGWPKTTVARDAAQVSQMGHLPEKVTGSDGKTYAAARPAAKVAPNLTADVERALTEAGSAGMTAWQLAFLINPAGPDSERAELTVRMAPVLESLASAGRAFVVGEVDGGQLWAPSEPADAQTPGPAADDASAVVGPGSTSGASSPAPEPEFVHVFNHQRADGRFDLDAAEEDFRHQLESDPSEFVKYVARVARSERKAWTDRETANLRKQFLQPALSPLLELDAMVPLGDGTVVRLGDMNHERIEMRRDMRRRAHEDEGRAYAAEVAFWERVEQLLQAGETVEGAIARGQSVAA